MATPKDPLTLLQVLEDEYIALHGQDPPGYERPDHTLSSASTPEQKIQLEREQLETYYSSVHRGKPQAALCLSGGGIRSATFCLGVIQALAKGRLLEEFDYLSTVSGGGYIGSWLTAWLHHAGDPVQVFEALRTSTATAHEPDEIVHLREFSNYLSPQVGLFSADFWTLLAIYLRNLLLNWLVLLPALIIPLLLPRLYLASLNELAERPRISWSLLVVGAILQIWVIAQLDWSQPSLGWSRTERQRRHNNQGKFLRWIWIPLLASAVVLTVAWYGISLHRDQEPPIFIFVGFQCAVSLVAWFCNFVASLVYYQVSIKKQENDSSLQEGSQVGVLAARLAKELLFILPVAAIGGLLIWRFATWSLIEPRPVSADGAIPHETLLRYACLAPSLFLGSFLLTGALLHGIVNAITKSDSDLEWTARSAAWTLIAILVWSCGAAVVLWGPVALISLFKSNLFLGTTATGVGGLSGLTVALLGKSEKTPASSDDDRRLSRIAEQISLIGRVRQYAVKLAVPAFILFLVIGLTLVSDWIMRQLPPDGSGLPIGPFEKAFVGIKLWPTLIVWTVIFAAITFGFGFVVNINKFSLHGMYRNRLIRAYLGASRPHRTTSPSYVPFTGFDRQDNIRLCNLKCEKPNAQTAPEAAMAGKPPLELSAIRPFQVINIALNLVAGKELAWQERKAESFTATALHCGCGSPRMGYRSSEEYGGGTDQFSGGRPGAMSLGGAMAISGAAASPNMGYHSSPTMAFLMSLLNVRLGMWFGNPGKAGSRGQLPTYGRSSPRQANRPFIDEALGLTDDSHPYVYLSDGGHFENLGLYEMVRRRCRYIVVCDAGQDPTFVFEDLGNAVRKIYIDFGVRIVFDTPLSIFPRQSVSSNNCAHYSAIGTILYSEVDGVADCDGKLLYVKPAFYGKEPADVCSYAKKFLDFPHDTTADQFFSESQFESYRGLGFYVMDKLIARNGQVPPQVPSDLFRPA